MEIQIASVCKTKDSHMRAIEEDYLKRFPPHHRVTLRELGGERFLKHSRPEQQKYHSELLTKLNIQKEKLIILDEGGKEFSTRELASHLEKHSLSGTNRLVLAVGGPCGWTEELKKAGYLSLALSQMTMPYQLARVVLVEQLYRCFTIQTNLPYHRS